MYLIEHMIWRYRQGVWVVPDSVPQESRYHGFSYKWDAKVLPLKSKAKRIKEALANCEIFFFFDESERLYSLLPETTKTVLFLDPLKWNKRYYAFAKKCTHTFSVSPHVTHTVTRCNLLENTILCPFDHNLQMMPKVSIASGKAATLFYPAYDMTFMERQCVRQIAEIVKACCPGSKSVIGCYDKNEASSPGVDARTYDWRLREYLTQTDWIIDLNPRPLMGLFSAFAGALGIQWSCFNVPPNTDTYSATRRHVVPYPKSGLKVYNAEEIAGHLVRQLNVVFNDDNHRNKCAGSYAKRLDGFTEAMNKLFKKKKKKK